MVSIMASENEDYLWPCLGLWIISCNLFDCFFFFSSPTSGSFLIGMHPLVFYWVLKWDSADLWSSFSVALYALCLENVCHFGLPRFPTLSLELGENAGLLLGSPPVLWLRNFSRWLAGANIGLTLFLFCQRSLLFIC